MLRDRLEHQLPITWANAVEIGFYVEVEHPGTEHKFCDDVVVRIGTEEWPEPSKPERKELTDSERKHPPGSKIRDADGKWWVIRADGYKHLTDHNFYPADLVVVDRRSQQQYNCDPSCGRGVPAPGFMRRIETQPEPPAQIQRSEVTIRNEGGGSSQQPIQLNQ
jgi:hypothetical protein